VEEYRHGLRDEAGNGEEDFALCKTISILSGLKILSAKSHGGVCGFLSIRMSDVPDASTSVDPVQETRLGAIEYI
jgi:hypothetical protein